jgi:hypothetical protein
VNFAVLMHSDEAVWAGLPAEGRAAYIRGHNEFAARAHEHGVRITGGEALDVVAVATTVRRDGDRLTVTEGPFAETVEQLNGFYLLDAPDLDAVVELLRLLPPYTFEIRPIIDVPVG